MPTTPSHRPAVTGLRTNPHAAEAAVFVDRWVRRTGLIQSFSAQRRFRRAGCAEFAARVMPDAECGRLKRGTAWLVWFFIFHDRSEEYGQSPPFADALLDFLPPDTGRTPPARTALERGLADAWRMVAPVMSPRWRERFLGHFGEFTGSWPAGSAARPLFDLIEYTGGFEVPPEVRELPSFRAVDAAAALRCPGQCELSPELLASRRKAFRRALSTLHRDLAPRRLPAEAVSAASAYTEALTLWMGGPPGGAGELPPAGGRLILTEDITGTPVDLLRPRRPAGWHEGVGKVSGTLRTK
ncbi:hypothetical protein [Streptomyces sp. ISL-11]|uniref:terpene synthase family protein n=1 Tax=Streptomyces sp. ISL-11 TaxID=2819174 RepID=UPI001BE949C9|nr:hypothetical protein [Streptomyces sp. ISL-11]MBT2387037.1 hypothetical protein [Streptomyces sp. ISL-11]